MSTFFKGLSLYLEARVRGSASGGDPRQGEKSDPDSHQIKISIRILVLIKVICRNRIRINVMRIRNTARPTRTGADDLIISFITPISGGTCIMYKKIVTLLSGKILQIIIKVLLRRPKRNYRPVTEKDFDFTIADRTGKFISCRV